MAEAIHCPSCSTRYRLRPERLKPVIRRARCYSCGQTFPVGDIVLRLLGAQPSTTADLTPMFVAAEDLALPPAPEPALQPPIPSLSLSDLDVADAEILDTTLVTVPESLPEAKDEVPASFPPEITETTLSGYTSARDAIEKLFGSANAPATAPRLSRDANPTDMEATLSAIENTLGAASEPPPDAVITHGDSPTAAGLTEDDLAGPSSSTMRLSQADLQAILDAAPAAAPAPAEPTVALRASDFAPMGGAQAPSRLGTQPFASLPEADTGAELLRLKIGEDIYGGLTMPQLMAWVEEGRILENHLVARQHSENWLEAHKVPGLRPVFERLRRERSGGAPSLNASFDEIAPKKSLFGGLFGKN